MRRYLFPLLLGVVGCGILVSLGLWQIRRLGEKQAYLDAITARIGAPALALPDAATLAAALTDGAALTQWRYAPVTVGGVTTGEGLLVLTGRQGTGAGYEVISVLTTADGRRVMLDRGFVAEGGEKQPRPPVVLRGTGNLDWPSETDRFTPAPDLGRGLWFARDVAGMAAYLNTEPVLIVARNLTGDAQGTDPAPVGTEGIPNNHLNYAITWFSLAVAWAGMTGYLLWRIRQKTM